MEQSPSTPATDPPAPSEPPRKARRLGEPSGGLPATITIGGRAIPLTAIAIGAAVLIVLIILIVPPVQVPARISWIGCAEISGDSPSADGPDGLNVTLADPNSGPLRLKMGSTAQDGLPAAAMEALPDNWTPAGPLYQTSACGNNQTPIILSVPATMDAASADALDLVSWNGHSWEWVGGHAEVPNGMVVAQLNSLPPNVMAVQTTPAVPVIGAELPSDTPISDKAESLVNEFAVPGFIIVGDGTLQGEPSDPPELESASQAMFAVTSNWDPGAPADTAAVEDVLTNDRARAVHIKALTDAATQSKYAGIVVDYRGVSADSRAAFTRFITDLAASLHKNKKQLVVVVPPATQQAAEWDTAGYDWRSIGAVADVVQLDAPNDPAAFGSSRQVEKMLRWGVGEVNRSKLQIAFSASSFKQIGRTVQPISYEEALKPFKTISTSVGLEVATGAQVKLALGDPDLEFDEASRAYRYTLAASDSTTSTIWLNTGASLSQKLGLALRFNLRGVMIKGLLTPAQEPGMWTALQQYQAQALAARPAQLQVVWTVRGADGAQLPGGTSPLTDTAYVWNAPANPGKYTIAAALPGSATRGEVVIAVAQPTPTPTPQPTAAASGPSTGKCPDAAFVSDVTVPDNTQLDKNKEFIKTWKVLNSGSCDWPTGTVATLVSGEKMGAPETVQVGAVKAGEAVEISVRMKSPDNDGNFKATWQLKDDQGAAFGDPFTVVIVAGQPQAVASANGGSGAPPPPVPAGTAGGFELGGQVDGFGQPDKMHYAGMNWVKHQVRWGPGDSPAPVAGVINDTHAKGFKVLLSVLGGPGDAKPANFPAYAAFVAGLAKLGPEAIEIWNEENIDREWQNGAINPGTYTELLKQSYVAIKNANPNVMVISGAPAPTGFFGGCSGAGCDDALFVNGMAAAGAAGYMDCIGAHYNEGIVGPNQTSGDPRSEHYTRYFWGMVNTYYGAFGGARKVCFTEMGYLTPEGYGGLPQWFAWARNTKVSQQAQWLAEAASLSASSGKVRLIIIFNVDFTYYGDDPQAGYAIIRPGGGCPACETLHQVLGTRSR